MSTNTKKHASKMRMETKWILNEVLKLINCNFKKIQFVSNTKKKENLN